MSAASERDLETLRLQLGRPVRGVRAVPSRCADGHPAVVETLPRLPDGTPFPTLYYLTCPNAVAEVSTLESRRVMRELNDWLDDDSDVAAAYRRAHENYLAARDAIEHVAEIAGVSAGGMPTRVKCLHALVAHSLAIGPGGNVIGDAVLRRLTWSPATCSWRSSDDDVGSSA